MKSEMSVHAGQKKNISRGQIIITKVTLERAPVVLAVTIYYTNN